MRSYASSKLRLMLLAGLLALIVGVVRPLYAAGPTTGPTTTAETRNAFSLVLDVEIRLSDARVVDRTRGRSIH